MSGFEPYSDQFKQQTFCCFQGMPGIQGPKVFYLINWSFFMLIGLIVYFKTFTHINDTIVTINYCYF